MAGRSLGRRQSRVLDHGCSPGFASSVDFFVSGIDREYAQPLDVEALAQGAHMSAGHLGREFRFGYGQSP
jgi:AraC-like DNA-binding protein